MSETMSRCPHCGARGVKLTDVVVTDGYTIVTDYCGKCGKNHPKPQTPTGPLQLVKG